MLLYKKQDDYLVGYDVRDNEIIQHYYNDKKEYVIPNIQHNIDFCDAKLEKQFSEIKPEDIKNLEVARNISITNLFIPDVYFLYLSLSINPSFVILLVPLVLFDTYRAISKNKLFKHFQLTNFCLEHVDEIKKITDNPNIKLKLSRHGNLTLKNDCGFTLNHSDRYSVNDLKQIQKAIGTK